MLTDGDAESGEQKRAFPILWPAGVALLILLAVAGSYLWAEHRAHLVGALLWLPLLACPLMHRFKHQGHRSQPKSVGSGTPPGAGTPT